MRIKTFTLAVLLSLTALSACSSPEDPGPPPEEVIHPEGEEASSDEYDNRILSGAVSVRIGQDGEKDYAVDMINNAAANTMLDYLSDSALLFPTYTYEEEAGFVQQSVRGSYTRDDEVTVQDVHAGELYLFGDSELRLYFRDVQDADITATPVGQFQDASDLADTVISAYEDNKDDVWGVSVYFLISKNIS